MHGVYKETEIKCQLPPDLFLQGPVCFFCRHMIQLEPRRMDLHDFFLRLCQLLLTVRAPRSSLQALLLNTVLVSLL